MPAVPKTLVNLMLLLGALTLTDPGLAATTAPRAGGTKTAPTNPSPKQTPPPLTLNADGQSFEALYRPPAAPKIATRGGIILLPGRSGQPNWPNVIEPLRLRLPKDGWATLSIQLPLPTPPGTDPTNFVTRVDARIGAAIAYMHRRGLSNLVLIGYDLGASDGAQYLALNSTRGIRGFVGIGMGDEGFGPQLAPGPALANVQLPILDLYGEHDLPEVRDPVASRARRGNHSTDPTGPAPYVQLILPGADHSFHGNEDALLARVRGWLRRYASAPPTSAPLKMAKQ